MAAYRRDRNQADILVHGKLKRDMPRQRPACKADCGVYARTLCVLRGTLYTASHALSAGKCPTSKAFRHQDTM